jgi:hypothetical protein
MSEIETHIRQWIRKVSKLRPELSGFPICPYASHAKLTIIQIENNNVDDITPVDGCDVVFFVLSNDLDLDTIQEIVQKCNDNHTKWKFFEDCALYINTIGDIQTNNGKYNLILAQPKEKLHNLRLSLAKTDYYKHWDEEYLRKILQDDYDVVKNIITG